MKTVSKALFNRLGMIVYSLSDEGAKDFRMKTLDEGFKDLCLA